MQPDNTSRVTVCISSQTNSVYPEGESYADFKTALLSERLMMLSVALVSVSSAYMATFIALRVLL